MTINEYYDKRKQQLPDNDYWMYLFDGEDWSFSLYEGFVPPSMKESVDKMNDTCHKYFALCGETVSALGNEDDADYAAQVAIDCHIEAIMAIYGVLEELYYAYSEVGWRPDETEEEWENRTVGLDKTINREVVDGFIEYARNLSGEVAKTVAIAMRVKEYSNN